MIFRIGRGVENMLALTPVLVEWRRRFGGPVRVETDEPEVLRANPYVDEAGAVEADDRFMDVDVVPWPKMVRHVTETYAEKVLGDCRLASWRTVMASTREDVGKARALVPEGRVAALCLDPSEMSREARSGVEQVLLEEGYSLAYVGLDRCGTLGVQRAAAGMASVFVGTDGPAASVAFTTEVPAVVCYTWRDPCYFSPFRRGVPFEALVHGENVCDSGKVCLAQNGISEFGKVYGHSCPKVRPFACREMGWPEMVRKAVRRAADKA